MYVPPDVVVEGGVQALTLFNGLIKIMEQMRKDKDATRLGFASLIKRMEAEAFALSEEFIKQVQAIQHSFLIAKIDPKEKIDEVECTSWWWKNRHDKLLESFKPNIDAITTRLTGFVDDVVALARCAGKEELLAVAFQEAVKVKRQIRQETDFNNSIGDIFGNLIKHAEDFRDLLK